MTLYSQVKKTIDKMEVGELSTIKVPAKLFSYRKFLSEIAVKEHKKFTTKVIDKKLHIMRIPFHSMNEKIQAK